MQKKVTFADLAKAFEALKSYGSKNPDDYFVDFGKGEAREELIEQILKDGEACKKK